MVWHNRGSDRRRRRLGVAVVVNVSHLKEHVHRACAAGRSIGQSAAPPFTAVGVSIATESVCRNVNSSAHGWPC